VSGLADWKERDQGRFYSESEAATRDGSRWLALPHCITPALVNYRKPWFAEVGAETDTTGKGVVLNSRNPIEAVKWMTAFWREACDEGGLAWDDTTNNRAFHSGEIAATLNGGSIYILARRRPDIKDQQGRPLWPDIGHFRYPDGPTGPTPAYHVTYSSAIMKQSKNVAASRELLKWLHSKPQYAKWLELEGGYATGANAFWERSPMWSQVDEVMRAFKTAARSSARSATRGRPAPRPRSSTPSTSSPTCTPRRCRD
jgi:multiple sugar transport system substrate-binding protein